MNLSYRQPDEKYLGSAKPLDLKLNGKRIIAKPRKHKWLKTIIIWSIIGAFWQIPLYYVLNQQVNQVLYPNSINTSLLSPASVVNQLKSTVTKKLSFNLLSSNISNPCVSYDDRYLAYCSGTSLEIYDFNLEKVIWTQEANSLGRILTYQWLPDRDSLLLFISGIGTDPDKPQSKTLTIHSIELDNTNSQVNDRFAAVLPLYLQTAKITNVSLSTTTNLLYFCAEHGGRSYLYQVDVMKNVKVLNHIGENVTQLAVSPIQGALYFLSSTSKTQQVMALNSKERVQVASNPSDIVLGLWNQQVYLGTVDQGYLTKIWTVSDNQPSPQRPNFTLFWEGQVPWTQSSITGNMTGNSLLIRNGKTLYQVSPQGSKVIDSGVNSFFSPSGKYYYTFSTDSSGTNVKRVEL